MRRNIPWRNIIDSEVRNEGPFGAEYMVPNLGRVWVGRGDLRDAANKEEDDSQGGLLCSLVTLETNVPEERVWAIVGFQKGLTFKSLQA